jgi:hypothetical protein
MLNGWKRCLFLVIFVGLIAPMMLSGCEVREAAQQALQQETTIHEQMSRGNFDGIYYGADQRYRDAIAPDKSNALFSGITKKLGSPLDCKQGVTIVLHSTWGTSIKSECKTSFSKNATAIETFIWIKSTDGQYYLGGYRIKSDALIE